MKKLTKALAAAALAVGLAMSASVPAQAVTYQFTTNCGSKNPKIFVVAASYVYTHLNIGSLNMRSGYGSWNYNGPDATYNYYSTNGKASVSYMCQ